MQFSINNIHCVDHLINKKANLVISNGHISYSKIPSKSISFDCSNNYIAYPAFINAYEKLSQSIFHNSYGRNTFNNIQNDTLLTDYDHYMLGALRNILTGTLWVFNSDDKDIFYSTYKNFGIHLIPNCKIMNNNILEEKNILSYYQDLYNKNSIVILPLYTENFYYKHNILSWLDQHHLIRSNTIILNGLLLTQEELSIIQKNQAHVIWCPAWNLKNAEECAPISSILELKINTCLGTGSIIEGNFDYLHNLQQALFSYSHKYQQDILYKELFLMSTYNAAKAFQIPAGVLAHNSPANFTIVQKNISNVFKNFAYLKTSDIHLVVKDGFPIYGSPIFQELFDKLNIKYYEILVEKEKKLLALRGYSQIFKKIKMLTNTPDLITKTAIKIL